MRNKAIAQSKPIIWMQNKRANKNKSEILQSVFEVHGSKAHDAMQVELTWNKTFTPMELDNGL